MSRTTHSPPKQDPLNAIMADVQTVSETEWGCRLFNAGREVDVQTVSDVWHTCFSCAAIGSRRKLLMARADVRVVAAQIF